MKKFIQFILYFLILVIIIRLTYIISQKIFSLLGYRSFYVVSGSMSPEIVEGETIIIKKCNNYEVGDIITFLSENEVITHRIHSKEDSKYYTKGDANNATDLEPIEYNQIYGKVIFHFRLFANNIQYTSSKYVDIKTFHIYGEIEK